MNAKGKLVFVTTELYPFTGGGIGRFTYNVLKSLSAEDLNRTVVLLTDGSIAEASFSAVFPGAVLWQLAGFSAAEGEQGYADKPEDPWLSSSIRILLLLRRMSRLWPIDYLEFPDWSGLGFATIQEKHLTGFLWNTVVAVRVHSTEAILVLEESRLLRPTDLRRYDLERKCYRDCDVIAAHLRPVAEQTRHVFGFSDEEWWPRVHIALPPVEIGQSPHKDCSIVPDLNTPIIFSSKFQEFKQPQVFVQGVLHFMLSRPEYVGDAVLACGGLESEYARDILSIVPETHAGRFKLKGGALPLEREQLIASGIVAFPSSFESLCLAAYEAVGLGAVVVINEANPAFGKETLWVDGKNCVKFDGSALGLSQALSACMQLTTGLESVTIKPEPQVWELQPDKPKQPWRELVAEPVVSVVVVNQNEGSLLADTLESIVSQSYSNLQLLVVDDASTDAASSVIHKALETSEDGRIRYSRLPVSVGRAAARNWALTEITGNYVMHLNAGDLVLKDAIEQAITALENCLQFDIVVSQVGRYTDADSTHHQALRLETYIGEAPVSGTVMNNCNSSGWICRAAVAREVPYRSQVGHFEGWAWLLDAVNRGKRIVVSPRIDILIRDKVERATGTPIQEPARLHHLMVAGAKGDVMAFPVASLALLSKPHGATHVGSQAWYRHMMEHSYEGEVEFMARFFGHSWLGQFIRRNSRLAGYLERSIRRVGRF